jgi:hypothetical protein
MQIVIGILLLVVGVALPMGMLLWLSARLGRKPALAPVQVGLLLAFNGVAPVSLVTLGLGLVSQRVWEAPWIRTAALASGLAAALLLIGLAIARVAAPQRGDDG